MRDDGRGRPVLENALAAWLASRDAGPAPDRLRLRVAHVSAAAARPAPWRPVVRALGPWLGIAAAVAVVAAGLTLLSIDATGGPAALPSGATTAAPSWSPPGSGGFGSAAIVLSLLAAFGAAGLVVVGVLGAAALDRWLHAREAAADPRSSRPSDVPEEAASVEVPGRQPLLDTDRAWLVGHGLPAAIRRTRLPRRLLAALLVLALGAGALNVTGLAGYPGGPLCDAPDCGALWLRLDGGGGASASMTMEIGQKYLNATSYVWNASAWPIVVERIVPRVTDPGLVVDGVYVSRVRTGGGLMPFDGSDFGQGAFDVTYAPLPLEIPPSAGPDDLRTVAIVLHATRAGDFSYAAFDVEYRIGPFRFVAREGSSFEGCVGPLAPGYVCPTMSGAGR